MKNICLFLFFIFLSTTLEANQSMVEVIKKVKPSVVGVGITTPMNSPANQLQGTGFVIGDGHYIATNYHVVSTPLNPDVVQYRSVYAGNAKNTKTYRAEIVDIDPVHDLAILKIDTKLTPLHIAPDEFVPEGTHIAFTGFPIGAVLGLYPASHRGMIAAITPDAIPARSSEQLSINMLDRLQKVFLIYQLDATAYPGNSGSPMYRSDTGVVVGVINKVFVAETKESVLSKPSGISYAIPVIHLRKLAAKSNIAL